MRFGIFRTSARRAINCSNSSTASPACWCSTICGACRTPSLSMYSGRARDYWFTTRDADLLVALGARELPLDVTERRIGARIARVVERTAARRPACRQPATSPRAAAICHWHWRSPGRESVPAPDGRRCCRRSSAGGSNSSITLIGSVFSSLRLSTDALPAAERDRYFELAVFPEDAVIPVAAICTLWRHTGGMERGAARDLLLRLHRRALLTRSEDGGRYLVSRSAARFSAPEHRVAGPGRMSLSSTPTVRRRRPAGRAGRTTATSSSIYRSTWPTPIGSTN